MAITIYDVAEEANVSMATVSRVVNGNPNVKPETRKKVLAVIERLGYRPNAVARGLASKKTTTIGVIVPDASKTFYAELSRGIADIATMYEYNIILSNSDKRQDREVELLEDHLGKQVDGIIFMSDSITPQLREEMRRANVPIVLAGTLDAEKEFPTVNMEYEEAAYQATKKLIENGHSNLAFVSGPFTRDINRLCKKVGFEKAHEEVGFTVNPEFILETDNTYDDAYNQWCEMLERDDAPTAILVSNDELAVGILNAIRDNKFSVPDDFEIICFEHSLLARAVRPQLTSVVIPLYDLGAVSMRLLTKLMNKEETEEDKVMLPYRFELRASTKEKNPLA